MKPSVGQNDPPRMPSSVDCGIDQRDLVGRHRRRLGQSLGLLQRTTLGQSLQDVIRRREPEVPGGKIATVAADFVGESQQLRSRQQRQSNVDRRAVLGTKAARRAAGAAFAGRAAAVDDEHIAAASGRQVIGDAGAHHAGTDDHDARVAHVRRSIARRAAAGDANRRIAEPDGVLELANADPLVAPVGTHVVVRSEMIHAEGGNAERPEEHAIGAARFHQRDQRDAGPHGLGGGPDDGHRAGMQRLCRRHGLERADLRDRNRRIGDGLLQGGQRRPPARRPAAAGS